MYALSSLKTYIIEFAKLTANYYRHLAKDPAISKDAKSYLFARVRDLESLIARAEKLGEDADNAVKEICDYIGYYDLKDAYEKELQRYKAAESGISNDI